VLPNVLAFFGQISGTGSLTYLGIDDTNSFLELEIGVPNGNPFSGGTTISNGYVRLNANPVDDATRVAAKSTGLGSGMVTFLGNSTLELEDYGVLVGAAQAGDFVPSLHVPAGSLGQVLPPGRGALLGALTGEGTLELVASQVRYNIAGNWSAFSGQINVVTFDGTDDFRVANALGYPAAKLHLAAGVFMYSRAAGNSVIPVGELSGDAGSQLDAGASGGGEAGNAVTWLVGRLNTDATFAGNTLNGGPTLSLTKEGAGTWTLSGTSDHTGNTTVSNGVLALIGETGLSNSAIITVASPGALDVIGKTDPTLVVGGGVNAQTLRGDGVIRGSVLVGSLGTVSPGFSIGTLTVTNAIALNGTTFMELNSTNGPATNDLLVAQSIVAGGTLRVTNTGPTLVAGAKFKLFNLPVTGFASVELPLTDSTGASYTWNDSLAADGSISVATVTPGLNTTPTNIVATLSGGALDLQWPESHTGWTLQTNSVGVTAANSWFEFPPGDGSRSTNRVIISINPAHTNVFYRLVYP
jgi:autotransporter-associated beta strand protein